MAQPEPLQAFFGAYNPTEAEMRQVLDDAAQEAERLIPKLLEKHQTGATLKAAQLSLILREVRQQQHAMWSDLSGVMRDGMERASLAAVEGESAIDRYLRRAGLDMPELRASFRAQAMRGFRNVLAKGANGISLSKQVYKTEALANGWIDRQIRKALILQTSAKDLAKQVRQFIDPNVKGGVSFAAFRLARTELNNAFHTVAKERLDEPWATGVRWHLSGSHPPSPGKPEVCETYARVDNGLGVGVWLPKAVPRKPHPNCLCYITQQVVGEDEFIDKLLGGEYDEYLGGRAKEDPPKKDPALLYLEAHARDAVNKPAALINHLVVIYGVKRDDAKAMVESFRPTNSKSKSRAKPKSATVVPLDPEKRPANAGSGVPKPGQKTGPVQPASNVPTKTPSHPTPSQPDEELEAHIEAINGFDGKEGERVGSALRRQAGFTPKTMRRLNGVQAMDRNSPSYGDPGVVGEYDERRRVMYIRDRAFRKTAQTVYERELKTGFTAPCGAHFDNLDNLIAHEYGHHVHDQWLVKASEAQRAEILSDVIRRLGLTPPFHFDNGSLLRWSAKNEQALGRLVSKYGATNPLEMMAEVWAEYTLGDPPRPHVRDAGELLQQKAEEHA